VTALVRRSTANHVHLSTSAVRPETSAILYRASAVLFGPSAVVFGPSRFFGDVRGCVLALRGSLRDFRAFLRTAAAPPLACTPRDGPWKSMEAVRKLDVIVANRLHDDAVTWPCGNGNDGSAIRRAALHRRRLRRNQSFRPLSHQRQPLAHPRRRRYGHPGYHGGRASGSGPALISASMTC